MIIEVSTPKCKLETEWCRAENINCTDRTSDLIELKNREVGGSRLK
jgi:hypothetical protein